MIDPSEDDVSLIDLYSICWSSDASAPDSAVFLAEHVCASSSDQLEVLLLDQLMRWRNGDPRPVEDYLAAHPTLTGQPEARLKLIQGEFLARLARGEDPDPSPYIRRFPELAEEIRAQCEVDHWLTLSAVEGEPGLSQAEASLAESTEAVGPAGALPDIHGESTVSSPPMDQDAPLRESDFQLTRPLGAGGMGEVFEATQRSLRKAVAVKLMRREVLDS